MEYGYLDIYPSQRVARQLTDEDPECKSVPQVIAESKAYLEIMESENLNFLERRTGDHKIASGETYKFLRSQERTRNTKHILQYLTTFLVKLPLETDIEAEGRAVNPFDQLKAFILENIALLKEKDVEGAILREHERLGLLNDTNLWYYRGQIDKSYKALREAVGSAEKATIEDYRKLFFSLQRWCTFWFSVRNEEIKRVRKSDLMLYRLTRYLLEKYK